MAQRTTLTVKQVEVLQWIADGCPDGAMDNEFHRISAAALRSRGLVTTSGRGPTWTARLTDAGREYLREVDGPNPPVARQANVSVTQQLVDDVIAAGGALRVPVMRWNDPDAINYRRRADLAMRHRKVPAGKRLEVVTVEGQLEIRLVDAPEGATVDLIPVAVPERVARFHPAARAFRDGTARHRVSRDLLARATRIVHAIAVEAERRGWTAERASNTTGRVNDADIRKSQLRIEAQGHAFWLHLFEEGVHSRGAWEEQVHHYRNVDPNSHWYRDRTIPRGPYDADASGRLKLELFCEQFWIYRGRQSRWADRQSWSLDERLAHLFREIEERIVEADRAAEEKLLTAERAAETARREAQERERQWHQLIAQAKQLLVTSHLATQLRTQADAWHETERLRRYCDALADAHGHEPATAEWLTWARTYITNRDPLTEPQTMPDLPEPTPEALQEHLPAGWSALGPDHQPHPRRRV